MMLRARVVSDSSMVLLMSNTTKLIFA